MRATVTALTLALVWTPLAGAGEPSALDLFTLVPSIRSSDPNISSLDMRGTMTIDGAGVVKVCAVYRAPDRFGLWLSDEVDQTPLVVVAEKQLMFYDPFRSSITYLNDCVERLGLQGNGRSSKFVLEVSRASKLAARDGQVGCDLTVDARSVFEGKGLAEQRVVAEGNGIYRLYSTRPERTVVAAFDLNQPSSPFRSVQVFERGKPRPVLTIDHLTVNEPVAPSLLRFPDREKLGKRVKIHQLAGDFIPAGIEMSQINRVIRIRHEIHHPGARADINKPPGVQDRTWKAIERQDKQTAALIRQLLPPLDPKPAEKVDPAATTTSAPAQKTDR